MREAQIAVSFVLLCLFSILSYSFAVDIGCHSTTDCSTTQCCTLQPYKYSIPTCIPKRAEGELCRPRNTPFNTSLQYPDGTHADVTVYHVLCDCNDGLHCSRKDGICKKGPEPDLKI